MATFSTNQVRQLYVISAYKATDVVDTDAVGTISIGGDKDNLYFQYKGVDGLTRTDIIKPSKVKWASSISADSLKRPLKKFKVSLNANVNGGAPVAGQEYILRIVFREWVGLSPEDQMQRYGSVYATQGMTAAQLYTKMVDSLNMAFNNEEGKLLSFEVANDNTGIIVKELSQPWRLGLIENVPVNFAIQDLSILLNGDRVHWADVAAQEPDTFVPDGEMIADLEYFCMGERGDVYRNMGWPKVIVTKYLVDPSVTYDVIDIHYFYAGDNEAVQKSEKTLTIVAPSAIRSTEDTGTNALITEINAALEAGGSSIEIPAIA